MVSFRTIAILGAIAIAIPIFIGLGGAGGIGSRIGGSIGGGLRTFGETLTGSFTAGLFNAINPFADTGGNEPAVLPEPTCGTGTKENIFGQCVPAEVAPPPEPTLSPENTFIPQVFAEPTPIPIRIGPIPSLFFAPAPISQPITQVSPPTIAPAPTIGAGLGGFGATREQLGL